MMDGSPLFVSLERGGASFLLFIRRAYQQLCNTLERLTAQPEPSSLAQLKQRISQRYGMLDLLDVFVEAERLVGFTHCFTHSGTTEVRSRAALQPLLLLALFAEGTNTGIKRVATANRHFTYDELLYVRQHYISIEALRQANWPSGTRAFGGKTMPARQMAAGSRVGARI